MSQKVTVTYYRKLFKENKIALFVIGAIFLCLAIGWISYSLFGHQLINAMYEGKSIGILNMVIEGQAAHPIEEYYKEADELFLGLCKLLGYLLISFNFHIDRISYRFIELLNDCNHGLPFFKCILQGSGMVFDSLVFIHIIGDDIVVVFKSGAIAFASCKPA